MKKNTGFAGQSFAAKMSLAVVCVAFCLLLLPKNQASAASVVKEPPTLEREIIEPPPPPPEREIIEPPPSSGDDSQNGDSEVHRRSKRSVTAAEQDESLNIHNQYRRVPIASDMNLLKWNDYLASWADTWAKRCNFAHGQPPEVANASGLLGYSKIGQNLYVISGVSFMNITKGVTSWFNERSNYNYANNSCNTGKVCGHYTQVEWSTSYEIGCSYAFCPTLTPINWSNAYYLVCNYGPAGNYVGVKPFNMGTGACSSCPTTRPYCNNGLCDKSAA